MHAFATVGVPLIGCAGKAPQMWLCYRSASVVIAPGSRHLQPRPRTLESAVHATYTLFAHLATT